MNPYHKSKIDPLKLIRIWKQIKEGDPLKVWCCSDFMAGHSVHSTNRHLRVLISLGLIEMVNAYYYTGKNQVVCRSVKAYRRKLDKEVTEIFICDPGKQRFCNKCGKLFNKNSKYDTQCDDCDNKHKWSMKLGNS